MVSMTDESPQSETPEASDDDSIQRGGELRHGDFSAITDSLVTLGPTGVVAAGAYVAGKVIDVVKEVKVAKIQSGNDQQGHQGKHRDE